MPSDREKGFYNLPSGENANVEAYAEGARARAMGDAQAQAEAGKPEKDSGHSFFPKTQSTVQGPAFVLVVMAPFLIIAYPAGGALTLASMFAVRLATDPFMQKQQFAQLLIMMGASLVAFYFALRVEAFMSRSRVYRAVRGIARLALLGGFALTLFSTGGRDMQYFKASQASGGAMFGALLATLFLLWLFYFLDRRFFPVADYVEADERRAARKAAAPRYGISTVGRIAIVVAPLMTLLGIGYSFPGASVVLLVVLAVASGWLMWRLFRRKVQNAQDADQPARAA